VSDLLVMSKSASRPTICRQSIATYSILASRSPQQKQGAAYSGDATCTFPRAENGALEHVN
jgi:hypothetical protein